MMHKKYVNMYCYGYADEYTRGITGIELEVSITTLSKGEYIFMVRYRRSGNFRQ